MSHFDSYFEDLSGKGSKWIFDTSLERHSVKSVLVRTPAADTASFRECCLFLLYLAQSSSGTRYVRVHRPTRVACDFVFTDVVS